MRRLLTLILLLVAPPAGAASPSRRLPRRRPRWRRLPQGRPGVPSQRRAQRRAARAAALRQRRGLLPLPPPLPVQGRASPGQPRPGAAAGGQAAPRRVLRRYRGLLQHRRPGDSPEQPGTAALYPRGDVPGLRRQGLCYPGNQALRHRRRCRDASRERRGRQGPASSTGQAQPAVLLPRRPDPDLHPCVLPMLPILSGVVLRGRPGGGRGFVLSLACVLPMALCFALLGALMGMFGASLNLRRNCSRPGYWCHSRRSSRCSPWPCSASSSCACPASSANRSTACRRCARRLDPRRGHPRRFPACWSRPASPPAGRLAALYQRQRRAWGRPATVRPRPGHGYAAGGVRRRRRRPAAKAEPG